LESFKIALKEQCGNEIDFGTKTTIIPADAVRGRGKRRG
jgi:hypothetical protein